MNNTSLASLNTLQRILLMKKYTFLYSIIAVSSLCANDVEHMKILENGDITGTIGSDSFRLTEDEQENLLTDLEIAVEEDAALTQARKKIDSALSLIQRTVPVGEPILINPIDEPLYKICMYALVLLKNAPVSMLALEQLYWSHSAVRTVGNKIKEISEHPHLVFSLAAIQKNLIDHAQSLLKIQE
jgi:hypothetical protein